jgi:tetratricopeptide (TPR) repeat protein
VTSRRIFALILLIATALSPALSAQHAVQLNPAGDAIDQGLWWLYHLRYDQARKLFTEHTITHPKDPAGYFYKTACDWWQLAQEFDRALPEVVARMDQDFQETVKVAEALKDSTDDPKIKGRACLYAGGAQGLKGRWLVTQGQWVRAYFMGKNGHSQLKKALKYDPGLYDAYLGLGIYDYFTDTFGGAQRVLAALLIRGDRKRGLNELQLAIDKGERARVEALMFLIEIYTWEEHQPATALPLAQQLHHEYPKSPAMSLAEIMDHYELKDWDGVAVLAQDYLEKSEREVPFYRKDGVFPARYCLGVAAFWGRHDIDTCFMNMQVILRDDVPESRWVTFALLRTAQVHDVRNEREKAVEYYQKILQRPNFWGSHQEAKTYLKQPFHF